MDIATIIGIVSGFALIIGSVAAGSDLMAFFNLPGLMVVIGGSLAATLIMFPLKSVLGTFKIAMNVFTLQLKPPNETAKRLVSFSNIVRKDNVLALEKQKTNDKFLGKGLRLCVDGKSPEDIKAILAKELKSLKERHKTGKDIFEQMGLLFPAFGMIGTLIGLVQMLQNLSDPSAIGPAMAVALLTTFYGAVLANLICIPIAKKLEGRSKEETVIKEIIIEGFVSIAKQENPRTLKDKLEGYLPPKSKNI